MTTERNTPNSQTSADERSEQLRRQLAAREAARTLDTFEAAAASGASVATGAAIGATLTDVNAPGFGETDSTEVTGDASVDQDLVEAAGEPENEELAEGQAAVTEYQDARAEQVSSLAPDEEEHGATKPPAPDDRLSMLGGSGSESPGGGGGGSNSTQTSSGGGNADVTENSGGGGGGNSSDSSIVGGGKIPDGVGTGADAVDAAGGPQADLSQLLGDPRDLLHRGAGNSAAADSDAVHDAFIAVAQERADTTTDKYSVADDAGDAVAAAAATVVSIGLAGIVASVGAGAAVAGVGVVLAGTTGASAYLATSIGDEATGGQVSSAFVTAIPGLAPIAAVGDIVGELVVAGNEAAASPPATLGESAAAVLGAVNQGLQTSTMKKGPTVRDPGNPDDDQRRGPVTEAEKALRLATDKLLGRNDALVHGPATEINPGEQGETFQSGTGVAPDPQATKEALIGRPREDARAHPKGEAGEPSLGEGSDHGGDIDFEDGSGFTGGIRKEGPEDVHFGRDQPLVGFDRDDDDSLPPDHTKSSAGKGFGVSIFDRADDAASEDTDDDN